jgi:hypothetical protein
VIARLATLAALVAFAPGGCTTEHQLFGDDGAPLTTCEQVWMSGQAGDDCDLDAPCARASPTDPLCCTQFAYCGMGGALVMDTTCDPNCVQCADDHSCAPGEAWCQGTSCTPCLTSPGGQMCSACPPGWVYLTRNGCQTCECAPPGECTFPDGQMCGDDPSGEECYQGARFADPGCAPDDPGCTANVCSFPGCSAPAPLGCFTACDPSNPPCGTCATDHCECDPNTGAWNCTQICLDQYPQSLTCFL